MKVTWEGTEYELKYSFRAMMLFENVAQHSFAVRDYSDTIIFFYCTLVCATKLETLDFDKFIDWLDENPAEVVKFTSWFQDCVKQQDKLIRKEKKTAKEDNKEADQKN